MQTFITLSPIPRLAAWATASGQTWPVEEPEALRALAAHYLLNARTPEGLPFDPVARFHLGNGAIVEAVHADADQSEKGQAQSGGAMVSYLYDMARVAQNHEQFETTRKIPASGDVRALASAVRLAPTQAEER